MTAETVAASKTSIGLKFPIPARAAETNRAFLLPWCKVVKGSKVSPCLRLVRL